MLSCYLILVVIFICGCAEEEAEILALEKHELSVEQGSLKSLL